MRELERNASKTPESALSLPLVLWVCACTIGMAASTFGPIVGLSLLAVLFASLFCLRAVVRAKTKTVNKGT